MGALMTSPKDIRNAILGAGLARANSDPGAEKAVVPDMPGRVAAGAVGAVSRSLSRFDEQLREAQKLAASGERIVELAIDAIDPSFARDRIEVDAEAQEALVASVREHGQQVPILVRPSPIAGGRYQIAYGHRRFRACAALGIPVRAVIRELDDSQLLVAQGQENSARKDLSFIERALFAATLEDRGFSRDVAMAALSTDKTELSKLISVVRNVPLDIIDAIGPAPKAGRTRWLGLAEKLKQAKAVSQVRTLVQQDHLKTLPSDERFARIFAEASAKPKRAPSARDWTAPTGSKPVRIEKKADLTVLTIRESVAPEFAEFVVSQLPSLFASYQTQKRS
jgi:ParB family transcriptional regulator, chromosome partitioning protein